MLTRILSVTFVLQAFVLQANAQQDGEKRLLRVKNKVERIKKYYYDPEQKVRVLDVHEYYNKDGERFKAYVYGRYPKPYNKIVGQFNERHQLTESTTFGAGDVIKTRRVHDYDSAGNRIATRQFTEDNEVISDQKRAYDQQGRLVSVWTQSHVTSDYYMSLECTYSEDGKESTCIGYNQYGERINLTRTIYQEGKISHTYGHDGIKEHVGTIYRYDEKGQLVERVKGRDSLKPWEGFSPIGESDQFHYDDKGNLVQEDRFINDELVTRYQYVYFYRKG